MVVGAATRGGVREPLLLLLLLLLGLACLVENGEFVKEEEAGRGFGLGDDESVSVVANAVIE